MKDNKLLKMQSLAIAIVMLLQILLPIFPLSTLSKAIGDEITGSGTAIDPWIISDEAEDNVYAYIEQDENNDIVLQIEGNGNMKDLNNYPWLEESIKETITKIVINNGVTNIGSSAFTGCSNVTNIFIPASVTEIGEEDPFLLCSNLTEINVSNSNPSFKGIDGVLYAKDSPTKTLIRFPEGKECSEYVIYSSVETIKNGAFLNCKKVEKIRTDKKISSVGENAFATHREGKTEVYYDESNTIMSTYANTHQDEALFIVKNLDSIKIDKSEMTKTQFDVGETFELSDLDGIKVTIKYNDGTPDRIITEYNQLIQENGFRITPAIGTRFLTADEENKISIAYTENGNTKGALFAMPVIGENTITLTGIELNTENVKKDYIVGETLDLTNLEVTAVYSDNTTQIVTNYSTLPDTTTSLQTYHDKVTITYQGISAQYNISVTGDVQNPHTLLRIELNTENVKKDYIYGERLDLSGLIVTAVFADNTTETVEDYTTSPRAGSQLNIQTTKVTVKYEGKTAQYDITVSFGETPVELSRIELNTRNVKKNYTVGEMLDLSELEVIAVYSDNTTETVEDYTTEPSNGQQLNTVGEQTVIVTYKGKTAQYNINVREENTERIIDSITADTTRVKKTYNVGETLDLTGLKVIKTYLDGTEEIVDSGFTSENGFTITPSNGATLTEASNSKRVIIAYRENGKTVITEFTIKVIGVRRISANTDNMKTQYTVGERLDLRNLVVTVTYTDNTTAEVTDYTTDPSNGKPLNTVGEQTVIVTYKGATTTFTVSVTEIPQKEIESISVETEPSRIYMVGDSLDLSGLVLLVTYTDGTTETITEGYISVPAEGTILTNAGPMNVIIRYGGKQTTFTIIVRAQSSTPILTEISIKTLPTKTTYVVGETLNLRGLVLIGTYSNGDTEDITRGYTSSPANGAVLNTTGRKTITITYEGLTTTFTVTVNPAGTVPEPGDILTEESTYEINESFIENVLLKTTIRNFISNFNNEYSVTLSDENAEYVGTGMQVTVKKLQEVVKVLEIVIKGDTTGDGVADMLDIFAINNVRLNMGTLEGAKAKAADMNNDSEINFLDILRVNDLREF